MSDPPVFNSSTRWLDGPPLTPRRAASALARMARLHDAEQARRETKIADALSLAWHTAIREFRESR